MSQYKFRFEFGIAQIEPWKSLGNFISMINDHTQEMAYLPGVFGYINDVLVSNLVRGKEYKIAMWMWEKSSPNKNATETIQDAVQVIIDIPLESSNDDIAELICDSCNMLESHALEYMQSIEKTGQYTQQFSHLSMH